MKNGTIKDAVEVKHVQSHAKTITAKFIPCTNYRGARIKATDFDGNSATIGYPHELSGAECYFAAAKALCVKMGWAGTLLSGWVGNGKGYAFVFVPDALAVK